MTLEEMREFVESKRKLRFESADRQALYGLVGASVEEPALQQAGKGRARHRARLSAASERVEPSADGAADRAVDSQSAGASERAGTAMLSDPLHGGRYRLAEPGGRRP